MIKEELKNRIAETFGGRVAFSEPMSAHTTIKTGGEADVFVVPKDMGELLNILSLAREYGVDVFFLGAGSNVLVRDGGFNGIIVSMLNFRNFKQLRSDGDKTFVYAEAGVPISELVGWSIENSLTGFEPLAGIPGTVGGALSMNAGTHDGCVSDILLSVRAVDRAGRQHEWPKEKIEFGYRRAKYPKTAVIVSAEFVLRSGSKSEIEKRIDDLKRRRRERHPLIWPSLGSIFMNPRKGPSAGRLIEDAGLKGVRVGGARIAFEHGNWIINEGNASSKDIEVLMHLAKEKVKENSGIMLETEIVIIGRE